MKPALIVVDMQYGFEASKCKKTIAAVIKLIQQFISQSLPIYLVDFDREEHGETREEIYQGLGDYDRVWGVEKFDDGGADDIMAVAENEGEEFDSCVVCGVNLDCCVYETARGLVDYRKTVTIAEAACNTPFKRYVSDWVRFREDYLQGWANVEIDEKLHERLKA